MENPAPNLGDLSQAGFVPPGALGTQWDAHLGSVTSTVNRSQLALSVLVVLLAVGALGATVADLVFAYIAEALVLLAAAYYKLRKAQGVTDNFAVEIASSFISSGKKLSTLPLIQAACGRTLDASERKQVAWDFTRFSLPIVAGAVCVTAFLTAINGFGPVTWDLSALLLLIPGVCVPHILSFLKWSASPAVRVETFVDITQAPLLRAGSLIVLIVLGLPASAIGYELSSTYWWIFASLALVGVKTLVEGWFVWLSARSLRRQRAAFEGRFAPGWYALSPTLCGWWDGQKWTESTAPRYDR